MVVGIAQLMVHGQICSRFRQSLGIIYGQTRAAPSDPTGSVVGHPVDELTRRDGIDEIGPTVRYGNVR